MTAALIRTTIVTAVLTLAKVWRDAIVLRHVRELLIDCEAEQRFRVGLRLVGRLHLAPERLDSREQDDRAAS